MIEELQLSLYRKTDFHFHVQIFPHKGVDVEYRLLGKDVSSFFQPSGKDFLQALRNLRRLWLISNGRRIIMPWFSQVTGIVAVLLQFLMNLSDVPILPVPLMMYHLYP